MDCSITLFRFAIDYTENMDGRPYPAIRGEWAPNAATALMQAANHLCGTRGYVSLDGIDPEPDYAKIDGETVFLHTLDYGAWASAFSLLAEQSGCRTIAEMRAFVVEMNDAPEAISARLMAEWLGDIERVA